MAESKSASISVAEMDADAFALVLEWMYEGRASVKALLLVEVLAARRAGFRSSHFSPRVEFVLISQLCPANAI